MTIIPPRLPVAPLSAELLAEDDVLPTLCRWHGEGLRTVLVTLVGIDGAAPRPLGAQMAVAEDGRHVGYLSGGCLEQAIVLEAQDVLQAGRNRLVRYGKGSMYIDIRLPCGSGLDVFFDCSLGAGQMSAIARHLGRRGGFALRSTLTETATSVIALPLDEAHRISRREGDVFLRTCPPRMRLLLLGTSPALVPLAAFAQAVGIETITETADGLRPGGPRAPADETIAWLDACSAVVLASHEHDVEPHIIARLLSRDCFYIGVLGSRAVHDQRLRALAEMGIDRADLARLRAPVGLIQGAKAKATLAVGILAELLAEAKARNLIA